MESAIELYQMYDNCFVKKAIDSTDDVILCTINAVEVPYSRVKDRFPAFRPFSDELVKETIYECEKMDLSKFEFSFKQLDESFDYSYVCESFIFGEGRNLLCVDETHWVLMDFDDYCDDSDKVQLIRTSISVSRRELMALIYRDIKLKETGYKVGYSEGRQDAKSELKRWFLED